MRSSRVAGSARRARVTWWTPCSCGPPAPASASSSSSGQVSSSWTVRVLSTIRCFMAASISASTARPEQVTFPQPAFPFCPVRGLQA